MKNLSFVCSAMSGVALLTGTVFYSQGANAGGFALIEQGASGMGNAYAGASALSRDASTVWFNPAGMLELKDPQVAVAGHVLDVTSDFTDRGTTLNPLFDATPVPGVGELNAGGVTFLPNLYYVRNINRELSFGFGISVPFGSSTEYTRDWVGRYQAVESAVSVIDFNPSIAYRVNEKVNVGGGISVQVFKATLGSAVDSGAVCASLFDAGAVALAECVNAGLIAGNAAVDGYADISGDSVAASFNLGLLIKPKPGTRVGLAYRHGVDHELDGDAEFTNNEVLAGLLANIQSPLFANQGVTAQANLPPSTMLSFAHEVSDELEILADATFTGWSSLPELRIKFDNDVVQDDSVNTLGYKDVWRLSAGLNYKQSDLLTLRAGVAYDEDPVPSAERRTPRLPGNERTWLAFGLGYKINDRMDFDVGYARVFLDDTPIDNASESAGGTTLRGVYESSVNLFSAQLNYKFN